MRRIFIPVLLLLFLLCGCASSDVPALPDKQAAQPPQTEEAEPEAEPETETEEPEPEPEPLAVTLSVTPEAVATPDAPAVTLSYTITRSGDGPEEATLQITRNGGLLETRTVPLADGTGTVELGYTFARYQPDRTDEVTLTLFSETQLATATATVTAQNWPDERYAAASGAALPYKIEVVKNHNAVLVYGQDAAGDYTMLVHAWYCSTGEWTPLGDFSLGDRYVWRQLYANYEHTAFCYGQYAVVISGDYLFHSVPYYTQNKDDLESEEYEKLGTQASLGCIRLAVENEKWIYDNCPRGTPVSIVERDELGVTPEPVTPLDPAYPTWDPTDPDKPDT